ncbi:MAG: hypothetical protein II139_10185, partial [Lachnospiraceae bacterium]|nr:hypothetical protein [Lachnospiraceae bacterium]
MSRNGKRKSTTKIIIFMVELIVVALLGVACYVVVRAFGTDPEKEGVTVVKLQEEKLEIAEEVKENETMKEKYETLEMEVIVFEEEDVIRTSNEGPIQSDF